MALVLHSVLEGLAAGTSHEYDFALLLCISISIHKLVAALVLGVAALRANCTMKELAICLGIFIIVTPAAMAIGMGFEESEGIPVVVINTLSAGTFIYVSCTEIIEAEFKKKEPKKWIQFLLVVAAGALIIAIGFIGGHNHGEEGHEGHEDHWLKDQIRLLI